MTSPEAPPSLEHGPVSSIITCANKLTAILSNSRRAIAQQTITVLENALRIHARKQGTISMNILRRTTYRTVVEDASGLSWQDSLGRGFTWK